MAREQKIEAEKKAESQKIEAIKAQISTYRSNLTDEKRLEIEQKAIVEILNERKITAEKFALSP
jgi:hypothetical protein